MKAVLEFNLDDVDDRYAHKRCTKSLDMALVLFELLHNSYRKLEYEKDIDEKTLNIVFNHFNELMEERNIMLDDLIE